MLLLFKMIPLPDQFPNGWMYSLRKIKFYRLTNTFGWGTPWRITKQETLTDNLNNSFLEINSVEIPSAEELLLQCFTFLVVQEANKLHSCYGCYLERLLTELGELDNIEDEYCLFFYHAKGCMLKDDKLVEIHKDEAMEDVKTQDLMNFYNKICQTIGVGKVSPNVHVKTYCETKGFDYETPAVYIDLFHQINKQ